MWEPLLSTVNGNKSGRKMTFSPGKSITFKSLSFQYYFSGQKKVKRCSRPASWTAWLLAASNKLLTSKSAKQDSTFGSTAHLPLEFSSLPQLWLLLLRYDIYHQPSISLISTEFLSEKQDDLLNYGSSLGPKGSQSYPRLQVQIPLSAGNRFSKMWSQNLLQNSDVGLF